MICLFDNCCMPSQLFDSQPIIFTNPHPRPLKTLNTSVGHLVITNFDEGDTWGTCFSRADLFMKTGEPENGLQFIPPSILFELFSSALLSLLLLWPLDYCFGCLIVFYFAFLVLDHFNDHFFQ